MILAIAGYLVAVSCIATYVYAASGRSLTPNLWANFIGGPIVAFGNALVGYWPAVILEVFFFLAGAYGLLRLLYKRKHPTPLFVPYDELLPMGFYNVRYDD